MGNWKSILGIFIILSALSEVIKLTKGYQSGKYESWPWGLSLGAVCVIILGSWLVKAGLDKKKSS